MKKTTKILIGSFALTLLAVFILPALLFTAKDEMWSDPMYSKLELKGLGWSKESELPYFNEIGPVTINDKFGYSLNGYNLGISITETDSVASPTVYLDSCWNGNVDFSAIDGILNIKLTMERLEEDHKGISGRVEVPEDNHYIARLKVPRGMLECVSAEDITLVLKGFKDARLNVTGNARRVETVDCDFNNFVVENRY